MSDELKKSPDNQALPKELGKSRKKRCFVIMPISDVNDYETGHFSRVYDYLIKPACDKAGFEAVRADKNQKSDFIVIDIVKQIVESDMAICDLSARNPNVFYELGIRQAFDLKTVLIKDERTARAFDISGIRTIEYSSTLRVDEVEKSVDEISKSILATYEQKEKDGNSLIQLLAVKGPAKLPDDIQLGNDSSIILNEIRNLRSDILIIQNNQKSKISKPASYVKLPNGILTRIGDILYEKVEGSPYNKEFGIIMDDRLDSFEIRTNNGEISYIPKDSDIWNTITIKKINI